jgi:hypothetical protein
MPEGSGYLHSDVVRTRIPEATRCGIRPALRHLFWDTATALNFAFLVNAAILIVSPPPPGRRSDPGIARRYATWAWKTITPTDS